MFEHDLEIPFFLEDSDNFSANVALILNFIQSALMLWNTLTEANVKMTRVGAAMTNTVFIVSHDDEHELPRKMLLRVYGAGVDFILDRKQELDWFSKLSDLGVGPKLYAAFKNGRLEEYVESETLTPTMMRDPLISCSIATSLARFHAIADCNSPGEHEPILWSRLESWRMKAMTAFKLLSSKASHATTLQKIQQLGVMSDDFALETLVNWRSQLSSFDAPIVFSHNDLQHGNILLTAEGNVVFIDYEYGGINYAAFDIANHFCEWASDFTDHNPHPEFMDFAEKYPTKQERKAFIEAYLSALNSNAPTEELIESWVDVVEHFKFMSNVIWGYWGVIQAAQSNIHFDYLAYSLCRFEEAIRQFN